MNYLIYADGACQGNGNSDAEAQGSFAVYRLADGPVVVNDELHERLASARPLHHDARFAVLPAGNGRGTNNMAEATALYTALAWACDNNLLEPGNEVHVCMDSQLILSQFMGVYRTREQHLRQVYTRTYDMLARQSAKVGCDVEKLIHLHWITGKVMKASVIAH
jgi:ribonuclease HI